ncbi:MAG TPA: TRAP transporter TatT component family protein [Steroidobacteraceae bacterium]
MQPNTWLAWPRRCAALLLTLGNVTALAAGPSRVEDSAADAVYECPMPTPDQFEARVSQLSASVWDKNSLGCAADLMSAAAEGAPTDVALQVQALLANVAYISHVNSLWDFDLYGIRVPEWAARIQHSIEHAHPIDQRLAAVPDEVPDLMTARALYKLSWPTKVADAKTVITETRAAQALLDKAVAIDPKALGGNAIWVLGRVYYDLPEFAGGDGVKAVRLLEQAYAQTPGNLLLLRYSAYVYAQERNPALARKRLAEMLAVEPDPADLQSAADELKNARDLATRLPDAALAQKLTDKRDVLLKVHPQLLARKPTAANMHGGVDPITGKEY